MFRQLLALTITTFMLTPIISTANVTAANDNGHDSTAPTPAEDTPKRMTVSTHDYMSMFSVKVNNRFASIFNPQLSGGQGTGFIVQGLQKSDGTRVAHIFTNKHVIDAPPGTMQSITIDLHSAPSDHPSFKAALVYKSDVHDFAILEVSLDELEKSGIPFVQAPMPLSQHDPSTAEGQRLNQFEKMIRSATTVFPGIKGLTSYAMGNPLGSDNIFTKGNITGFATLEYPVIQTQTPINPGNSGGPLAVEHGEGKLVVVGINTAIILGAQSVGYSLPIGMLMQEYNQWLSGMIVPRPKDYALFQQIDPARVKEYGYDILIKKILPDDKGGPVLQVASITRGSPLLPNDILLKIEGDRVYSMYQFKRSMLATDYREVKELNIEVLRDGQVVPLKMPLAPLEYAQARKELDFVYLSGFVFQQLPGKLSAALRPDIKSRVFVSNVVSNPEMLFVPGLNVIPPYSLLQSIDIDGKNYKIETLFELKMALKNVKADSVVLTHYYSPISQEQSQDDDDEKPRHKQQSLPSYSDQIHRTRISKIEVITPRQLSLRRIKESANLDPFADETSRHWRNYVKPTAKATCIDALTGPSK